jgi:hypothetical protein
VEKLRSEARVIKLFYCFGNNKTNFPQNSERKEISIEKLTGADLYSKCHDAGQNLRNMEGRCQRIDEYRKLAKSTESPSAICFSFQHKPKSMIFMMDMFEKTMVKDMLPNRGFLAWVSCVHGVNTISSLFKGYGDR